MCDFACSGFHKFAKISPEMKKILYFIMASLICVHSAESASRTENAISRGKSANATTSTKSVRGVTSRNAIKTTVAPRNTAKNVSILAPRTAKTNVATRTPVSSRSTDIQKKNVTARAATMTSGTVSETRTGAEYEQCKTAFFTCMDQFCQFKNDSFRRCSCNDRVFDFQDISEVYQKASDRLTEFSEDLDVVGMTREQATAMKTASEGEDALTEDKSASKQLLQAIMNSIKGGDTSVGGKYKDLNSVTIAADISNAFGMEDSGQIIAAYNGAALYKAVYPKCRSAVKEDCNNASLQRAVNAYLMAIEQDCNSVESALQQQKKNLKASTHQSSAMLDLARVENRRNHNSDDISTCLTNVESAIKSEEVCGDGYHKCLDYGQFIDVTTGAPLTGVADFYKLGELLTYKTDKSIQDQNLSSIRNNRTFVQFFESKTKKFAKDALDKCSEDADYVWQQYLDRALVDIYYAQQSKVKEIKQSCLTLVARCYDNQNTAIANAMANLTGDSSVLLQPEALSLSEEMCSNYIESCNGMFNGDIINEYVRTKGDTDSLNACRAIAQQCFDNAGGTSYNNFYSLQSGLFTPGEALDWFSLYKKDASGDFIVDSNRNKIIVSPCAQQLAETPGCDSSYILEEAFGGFDKYVTITDNIEKLKNYSFLDAEDDNREIRVSGVATEVFYKTLNNLSNHCNSLGGAFIEYKDAEKRGYNPTKICHINSDDETKQSVFAINTANTKRSLVYWYHFVENENMCPANYEITIDTQSWGLCSCWENGGQRSKNGQTSTCRPLLPAISGSETEDIACSQDVLCKQSYSEEETVPDNCKQPYSSKTSYWCQQNTKSSEGKLCPTMHIKPRVQPDSSSESTLSSDFDCADGDDPATSTAIRAVIDSVPERK